MPGLLKFKDLEKILVGGSNGGRTFTLVGLEQAYINVHLPWDSQGASHLLYLGQYLFQLLCGIKRAEELKTLAQPA